MTDPRKGGLPDAHERQPGTALVPVAVDTDPSAAPSSNLPAPRPAEVEQGVSATTPLAEAGAVAVSGEVAPSLSEQAQPEGTEPAPLPEAGSVSVTAEEASPVLSTTDAGAEPAVVEDDTPGWFSKPQIDDLQCLYELRLPEGRTLVAISWSGWGSLHARAELDGQVFHRRLRYGWPGQRVIDFLVPMGANLTVTVRNAWGSERSSLKVLASEPALPVIAAPRVPDVIGVRMPQLKLPPAPSATVARLIPSQLGGRVVSRRPLPAIDDRLQQAIALESRRLSRLPAMFGSAQQYQREKLSPACVSLRVGDVDMVPVRDRLKAWMVEIHAGEDETEGG